MSDCKPCPTPLVRFPLLTYSSGPGVLLYDISLYRSTVGALQHICYTRPNISYSVNWFSQFLDRPREAQWGVLKRVMRYLKVTLDHRLMFRPSTFLEVVGFTNSYWGADTDDERSTRYTDDKRSNLE